MTPKVKTGIQLTLLFSAAVGGIWYLLGRTGGAYTHEERTDWGAVTVISNCSRSKYSLNCTVATDRVYFDSIDITDFPSLHEGPLAKGDRIGKIVRSNDVIEETFYTRNGYEVAHSSCMDYMPCFKKK